MPACTFFGHRDCPDTIKPRLREVLVDLIENHNVDMFYTESMVDTVSKDLSFWHVFGRKIQNRDVYIKVRIKQRKNGTGFVFCISFHFARHIIADFPYK